MSSDEEGQYQEIELQPHEEQPLQVMEAGVGPLDPVQGSYFVSFLVDLSNRPDLVEIIEAHKTTEGECTTRWFTRPDDDAAFCLLLSFTSPIKAKAILSFDILRHGLIVDSLINGRGSIGCQDRFRKDCEPNKVIPTFNRTVVGRP